VTVHHEGQPAAEVLSSLLGSVAGRLTFPKTMRWLDDDTRFARPVRWLVALLGHDVLPLRAFGLNAGRASQGHRTPAPGNVDIASASDYVAALAARAVIVDHRHREEEIRRQLDREAGRAGGRAVADSELIEINNFLVETPTGFVGGFDSRYLDLPRE